MQEPPPFLEPEAIARFGEEARRAIYDVIALRRDIRHFRSDLAVGPEALQRIFEAAHQAPSVGLSQPWGFVVVRDIAIRSQIRDSFLRCREAESIRFPPERRESYLAHKLEGILEAPINVCVAVDLRDRDEAILGTTAQPEAVRASACCAVQNLWLAARAEGIGVGWVSIVEPAVLRRELVLPPGVEPIAYLCVGHPVAFRERPMLEETQWRTRRPLTDVVHWHDRWNEPPAQPPPQAEVSERSFIPAPSTDACEAARAHLARLTKPIGSLGRLEEMAMAYAGARGLFPAPVPERGTLAIFAGDHGVVVEGVSAYGSQLTAAMVANVMSGGAAIHAIARQARVDVALVDVGVAGELSSVPTSPVVELQRRRVRAGTGNLRCEPAMHRAEAEAAMAVGAAVARDAIAQGAAMIGLGEIGIGNTTAAAALISALTGVRPAEIVGRGTGVSDAVLARKIVVVEEALALHELDASDPLSALSRVGGLEIAALVGCALAAARHRIPVVLDGLVTNAAALVAAHIDPALRGYLFATHASPEPGAKVALAHLGLEPLFDWRMRLGEGTGAALGMALLRTAVATVASMATFATAGIVRDPKGGTP